MVTYIEKPHSRETVLVNIMWNIAVDSRLLNNHFEYCLYSYFLESWARDLTDFVILEYLSFSRENQFHEV